MRKLDLGTPSEQLVNGYLSEIAKAYGVKWSPPGSTEVDDEVSNENATLLHSSTD